MSRLVRMAVLAFMHDEHHPTDHLKSAVFAALDIEGNGASRFVDAATTIQTRLVFVSIPNFIDVTTHATLTDRV